MRLRSARSATSLWVQSPGDAAPKPVVLQQHGAATPTVSKAPLSKHQQSRHSTGVTRAAVSEKATGLRTSHLKQPAGEGVSFRTGEVGYLNSNHPRAEDIGREVKDSPFYLYSKNRIAESFQAYEQALQGLSAIPCYAVHANNNLLIAKLIQSLGSGAVVASGTELKLALEAGFDPNKVVFDGKGKLQWELELAADKGVFIILDSELELDNVKAAAKKMGKKARVLLKINLEVDSNVHKYASAGIASSEFGIRNSHLQYSLDELRKDNLVELVGVHGHLGATTNKVNAFRDAALTMSEYAQKIRSEGFELKYLSLLGGLGSEEHTDSAAHISPASLIDSVRDIVTSLGLTLIIEPGRSMTGTSCAVVDPDTGSRLWRLDENLVPVSVHEVEAAGAAALRLEYEAKLRDAYEAGYQAGYTSALKMEVTVDVEWFGRGRNAASHQTTVPEAKVQAEATTSTPAVEEKKVVGVPHHVDSWQRSAVKGMTWRVMSTATTIILAFMVMEMQVDEAMELGIMDFVSKYILYFIHERAWAMVTLI